MPTTNFSVPANGTLMIDPHPEDSLGNSVASDLTPSNPLVWTNSNPELFELFPAVGAKLTAQVHAIGGSGTTGTIQVSGSTQGGPVASHTMSITITAGALAQFHPTAVLL